MKNRFYIIIASLFILSNNDAIARAGGGGGHSGGGGGSFSRTYHKDGSYTDNSGLFYILLIALIGFFIYSIVLSYFFYIKSKKSKKTLILASSRDSIWNIEEIKNHTFDVFCKTQKAWENRYLGSIKSIISKELYDELDVKIGDLRKEGKKNILEEITVNQITLLSCIDFKDNTKDEFTAQIDGQMIDYTIDDKGLAIIENESKSMAGFTDCYQFIRKENKWILNKIYNDTGIFHVMDAKSHFEK